MPKLIAIIDDELEMEDIYSMYFEDSIKENYLALKFFSDARLFYEWFIINKPDMILCDIEMPHLTGPELCQKIQNSGHSIQTYFVSGHHPSDYQEIMCALNIAGFIRKPLCPNQFPHFIHQEIGISL